MVQEKEERDKVNEDDRKRKLKEARAQRLAETKETMTAEAKKLCVDKARSEYPEWTWRDREKRQARGQAVLCNACDIDH